jgi:hypothetical protein
LHTCARTSPISRSICVRSATRPTRLAVTWRLDERHALRFTAAPLRISDAGVLERDVLFESCEFLGGEPTRGSYEFSNYRLTYRRMFPPGERWHWGIGGALFVRDAVIALRQGALQESNDDVGLVPLLHRMMSGGSASAPL